MRAYAGLWGTMFGVVLVAAVTSTAMMGPPGRRSYLDAELAEAVANPASVVALVLGVLVVLLPLPSGRSFAAATETLAITVLVLVGAVVAYRAVVGADDDRQFDAGTVEAWLLKAAGILVVLTVLAVRADLARRRQSVARRPAGGRSPRGIRP